MRAFALSSASRHSLSTTPVVAAHAPLAAAHPAPPLAANSLGGPAEAARQAALRSIPRAPELVESSEAA